MFLVVLCIFIFNLKLSTSQFPQHTDFQKVGETIFNNENYKILKPVTHTISDYFEDFMLKKIKPNPTKRLFIDDNSLRHHWTGFDKKNPSLRKTEIITSALDTDTKENVTDKIDSVEKEKSAEKTEEELSAKIDDSNDSDKENSHPINSYERTVKKTTLKDNAADVKNSGETRTLTAEDDKVEEVTKKKGIYLFAPSDHLRQGIQEAKDGDKTVVKTTFFCPYFGVITMSAFID